MPTHHSRPPADPDKQRDSLSERAATIALCDGLAAAGPREATLALDVGREALAHHGEDAEVLTAVGRLYLGCGLLDDAVRVLTDAARVGEGPRPYRLLGEALLRQGDAQIAVPMLARAISEGDAEASTRALHASAQIYARAQREHGSLAVAREVAAALEEARASVRPPAVKTDDAAPTPSQRPSGLFGRLATWGFAATPKTSSVAPAPVDEDSLPRFSLPGDALQKAPSEALQKAAAELEELPRFPSDPDWKGGEVADEPTANAHAAMAPSDAPWSLEVEEHDPVDFDLDELGEHEILEAHAEAPPSPPRAVEAATAIEPGSASRPSIDVEEVADAPTVDTTETAGKEPAPTAAAASPKQSAATEPAKAAATKAVAAKSATPTTAPPAKPFAVGATRERVSRASRTSRIVVRSAALVVLFVASFFVTRKLRVTHVDAPTAAAQQGEAARAAPESTALPAPAEPPAPDPIAAAPAADTATAVADTSAPSAEEPKPETNGETAKADEKAEPAKTAAPKQESSKGEAAKAKSPAPKEQAKTEPVKKEPAKAAPPKSGKDVLWLGDPERRRR